MAITNLENTTTKTVDDKAIILLVVPKMVLLLPKITLIRLCDTYYSSVDVECVCAVHFPSPLWGTL